MCWKSQHNIREVLIYINKKKQIVWVTSVSVVSNEIKYQIEGRGLDNTNEVNHIQHLILRDNQEEIIHLG